MVAARRAAGVSQQDLADELTTRLGYNVDRTTVSRMEQSRRGIDWTELRALRDIFGVSADWFLDGPAGVDRAMRPQLNWGVRRITQVAA